MKTGARIFTLVLAMIFLLGTTVMAMPANTVVMGNKAFSVASIFKGVDGIQAALDAANGKLYYSLEGQTNGFVGLFNGQAMTQAQKDELGPVLYTKADGSTVTYAPFDDELTVKGIPTVINATTISVTFSNGVTQQFTVEALAAGENTRKIRYLDKDFVVKVTYTVPPITAKTVSSIYMINYRNIRVTFDGLVDKASATNPANYYFEIVDGDAAYGALPTLRDSNQLSKIETAYTGGAAEWWKKHIIANDVNGKTVVDIFLPEDARFTNVVDDNINDDAERTLSVEQQTAKNGFITLKALTKDTVVNVAVRNVKDIDGKFTISTAVKPIRILDEEKPELKDVKIVSNPIKLASEPAYGSLGKNLGRFDLLRTKENQVGEKLQFVYSEPVFDAHGLDKSDIEDVRDIRLYVNGKLVASTARENLDDYMTFRMDKDAKYADSKVATLDVEKAIIDTYKELFAVGLEYEVRFVGVTDLAGNIEVSSEHSFIVKFHDADVVPPVIVMPVVKNVVQVADNVFRVEFNRAGVEGTFVIKNPDGEGVGELRTHIEKSQLSKDKKSFYSYVAVPARDEETNGSIEEGVVQNKYLSYDKQDTIYRNISVEDVVVKNDDIAKKPLYGESKFINGMAIVNDILAPIVLNPNKIEYDARGTTIDIDVKDITPWSADENIDYWAAPIAYVYNPGTMRFENRILPAQNADTYLPVKVSYVDASGAVHQAMVSNYNLRPYDLPGTGSSDLNPGYPNSIRFNDANDRLTLDLSQYPQLLNAGRLVPGATYKVEMPKGYFTDRPLDTHFGDDHDLYYSGHFYDLLYVDTGRDGDDYNWYYRSFEYPWEKVEAGLGYTSDEKTVNVVIGTKSPEPEPEQYVPQTSKQLITYDEATKSMKIEFTGTIDLNTLKNKANYTLDGKTLAQWDALLGTNTVIDYVLDDSNPKNVHQFAMFRIPQDSIQEMGDYAFRVEGVAHPNGAKMTPVDTVVKLYDNYRPVVIDAHVTGDKQIKLTFNEPIQYFVDPAIHADPISTAKNFKVMIGGSVWTVDSAVLPVGQDNNREVILNLGNVIPADGAITVEIVPDQNKNILIIDKSAGKNPAKTASYSAARP